MAGDPRMHGFRQEVFDAGVKEGRKQAEELAALDAEEEREVRRKYASLLNDFATQYRGDHGLSGAHDTLMIRFRDLVDAEEATIANN